MADQVVKVNLQFNADTSQAINNMNSLKSILNNIGTKTTIGFNSGAIDKAVQSAQQLNLHLEKAVNVNTGKLDLTKLNTSLKQAGTNLNTLSNNILAVGPQGQQAFLKLATAVSQAEVPMYKMSKTLSSMGTTLLNTIKWSISSSAINAFTSSIQEAVTHAKNLNTALNEIRIVTGYSTEYMADFAKQASKAADALGTTTTQYAKAALIFYQQGLDGKEVLERADTVVKLANVTGQTAEQVSSQMTAIWNNFAKGTESLEYYADVLTKLGATTAANTTEIATAMEKFAATAEVIGLNYETAASAVATVVAETRQSADVIGTAYKTIFARIQGLKLGETLEDGVGLNQYSEALQKVGVRVIDASGNLRRMDDILADLGDKWNQLTDAQRNATAQTVAGLRQYNQFIALMENWDKVQSNVKVAELSEGELTVQQEIWSESWEAASNRVKKAKDDLYEQFLNDEAIVKLTDSFAQIIKTVNSFIDSLGGVGPMLLTFGGLFSSFLFPLITTGFMRIKELVGSFTGQGLKETVRIQQEFTNSFSALSPELQSQLSNTKNLIDMKNRLSATSKLLSKAEKEEALARLEVISGMTEAILKSQQLQKELKKQNDIQNNKILRQANDTIGTRKAVNDFNQKHRGVSEEKRKVEINKAQNTSQKQILNDLAAAKKKNNAEEIRSLERIFELQKSIVAERKKVALDTNIGKSTVYYSNYGLSEDKEIKQEEQGRSIIRAQSAQEGAPEVNVYRTQGTGEFRVEAGASIENFEKLIAAQVRMEATSKTLKAEEKDLEAAITSVTNSLDKNGAETEENKQTQEKAKATAKNFAQTIIEQKKALLGLKDGDKELKKLETALQSLEKEGTDVKQVFNTLKSELSKLSGGAESAAGQLEFAADQVEIDLSSQGGIDVDDLTKKRENITESTKLKMEEEANQKDVDKTLNSLKDKLSKVGTGFSAAATGMATFAGQAMSVVSGVNMMSGAFDDGVEPLQRATMLLSGFSMLIPGLLGGIDSIKKGYTALFVTKKLENGETKKGLYFKAAETVATWVQKAAKDAETGSVWGHVAALIAEQMAMAPVLGFTLLLVAAVATLAAGIFAVVMVTKTLTEAYNKDANAAKNAAEAAKALGEEYENTKQKYENMIAAMEEYQTARDGLSSLMKGTLEYKEALEKANNAALELINTLGLIKGQDYDIDNGEITFNSGVLDKAKEAEFAKVQEANARSMMANAEASRAAAKSEQTSLVRRDDTKWYEAAVGITGNEASYIGSVLSGPIGGMIAGQLQDDLENKLENEKIDKLVDQYKQDGSAAFEIENLKKLGFDTANQQYIDSLKKVVEATGKASEQLSLAAEMSASAVLQGMEDFQNSDYQNEISKAAARNYEKIYNDAYEEAEKNLKNDDWFGVGSEENKQAIKDYAEETKLSNLQGFKVTNYTRGGGFKYQYFDTETNKVETKEVNKEQVATVLATKKANEELERQSKILAETFDKLNLSANESDQALSAFASEGLGAASKTEFEALKSELSDNIDEKGKLDLDAATDYIKKNFTKEQMDALGFESTEQMAESFKENFETALVGWDNLRLPENFINVKGLSYKTTAELKKIIDSLGETGEEWVEQVNSMIAGLDAEDQIAAIESLTAIDWSAWDAGNQAAKIISDLGGNINTTSDDWQQFINNLRSATDAVPDLTKLEGKLTSIRDIINDLSSGKIIEVKDYEKLIALNAAFANMFVKTPEGYQLISTQGEAKNLYIESTKQEYLDVVKKAQADYDKAEEVEKNKEAVDNTKIPAQRYQLLAPVFTNSNNLIDLAAPAANTTSSPLAYTTDKSLYVDPKTKTPIPLVNLSSNTTNGNALKQQQNQEIVDWVQNILNQKDVFQLGKEFNGKTAEEIASSTDLFDKLVDTVNKTKQEYSNLENKKKQAINNRKEALTNLANQAQTIEELNAFFSDPALRGEEYYTRLSQLSAIEANSRVDATRQTDIANSLLADKDNNYTYEHAQEIATAMLRQEAGQSELINNLETWKKALVASNEGTLQYVESLGAMQTAVADLLNIDKTQVSEDFILSPENQALIQQAISGNTEAFKKLRKEALNTIKDLSTEISAQDIPEQFGLTGIVEQFNTLEDLVDNILTDKNIKIGVEITGEAEEKLKALGYLLSAMGLNTFQVEQFFKGMGFETTLHTISSVQTGQTLTSIYKAGGYDSWSELVGDYRNNNEGKTTDIPGYIAWLKEEKKSNQAVQNLEYKYILSDGSTLRSKDNLKVGSVADLDVIKVEDTNSPPGIKPPEPKDFNPKDWTKPYEYITQTIEDNTKAYEKLNKEIDKAYGPNHIKQIEKANKKLEEIDRNLKDKKQQVNDQLWLDTQALLAIAKDAQIDANGNVINYADLEEYFRNQVKTAYASGNTTAIENAEKAFNNFKTVYEAYLESNNLLQDTNEQIEENAEKIRQNLKKAFEEKLKLKIEIDEAELKKIDSLLKLLDDDWYNVAERMALTSDKMQPLINQFNATQEAVYDAAEQLKAGILTEAEYAEQIKTLKSELGNYAQQLYDLDKEMQNLTENGLQSINEEFTKQAEAVANVSGLLEHYKNIIGILGKEQDLDAMGIVLAGQVKTAKNELQIAQEWFNTVEEKKKNALAMFNAAQTEEEKRYAQKYLDAVEEMYIEAQESLYEKASALAEAATAELENNIAKARKTAEEALTGGYSFSELETAWDRINARQEDYLTKTNQMYETNKMMRTVQQAMDKTDNEQAKQKYKAFNQYLESLSKQGELSKYELEVAQAKFDLLEAEIALEDAKNAKSTVRLTRDAEGNWGYMYTADEDKIADAEQAVEDKRNALYNKGLEGTKEFEEKRIQIMQEALDELDKIDLEYREKNLWGTEEHLNARNACVQHYNELFRQSTEQFNIAHNIMMDESLAGLDLIVTGHTELEKDLLDGLDLSLSDFTTATTEYMKTNSKSYEDWATKVKPVADLIGLALDNPDEGNKGLAQKTDAVTDETERLTKAIVDDGGLIDALDKEWKEIEEARKAWEEKRLKLLEVIDTYKALLEMLTKVNQAMNGKDIDYKALLNAQEAAGLKDTAIYNQTVADRENKIANMGDLRDELKAEIAKGTPWSHDWVLELIARLIKQIGLSETAKYVYSLGGNMRHIYAAKKAYQFDTGGYTGTWGPDGKLAVLHQKELVLNEMDTSNILAAVEIIRSIGDMLDQRAALAMLGMNNLSAFTIGNDLGQTLQQDVTIHAEFPNVQDHNEIEMALTDLVNAASQYANRF